MSHGNTTSMNPLSFLSTSDAKWCALVVTLMAVSFSLSPEWQLWLMDGMSGQRLRRMQILIEGHILLNLIIVLLLICLTFVLIKRWSKDKDNRWYRFPCVLFCLQLLWIKNPLTTPTVFGWLDYRWVCTICLLSMLAVLARNIVRIVFGKAKEEITSLQNARFEVDRVDPHSLSDPMKQYGNVIVRHLLGTRLHNESFAIGITGTWGSGKTTFMEYLAVQLTGKAEIVRFNPWMCRTPEQVTEDFFMTLHHQLSSKYSRFSRPIRDYARFVNATTFTLGNGILSKLTLAVPHESLRDRKERLAELFSKLKKPVVVFIDDLDRLESNEVFEVLRLIRNTADFSNVFYVVTYDKTYVTGALTGKGISNPDAYLEKIFPIEVHQPKVEDTQLYEFLRRELSMHYEYKERLANKILGMIDQSGREIVMDILNTYRRVLRFSRLFLLNLDYLQMTYKREMRMIDLFWMELLQMYDRKTYEILANDRDLLLNTLGKVYSLKSGIAINSVSTKGDVYAYKGEIFWRPLTPQILTLLFEDKRNVSDYSIRYAENYDKYFTLSISKNRLSFQEFEQLFNNERDSLNVVAEWVKGQKYFSSMVYHFEHTAVNNLSSRNIGKYVMGLLELAYLTERWNNHLIYTVKNMLRSENFSDELRSWGFGYMLGWFNEKISKGDGLRVVSKMLNRFYIYDDVDEHGTISRTGELLISNDDVKGLLRSVMVRYLESHPDLTAIDVVTENSEILEIFGNCTVCLVNNNYMEDNSKYENVAFDIVIKHFAQKIKPSYTQFDHAMNNLFRIEVPEGLSPMEYDDFYNGAVDNRDRQLVTHFGSDWDKVTAFKERCFENNE